MRLDNKVVIVTGASRGIGKVVAKGLAREGARVVVTARTERPEQSKLPGTIGDTVEQIVAEGGQAIAVPCNIAVEGEVNAMVAVAQETYGPIDVLVNNAGVLPNDLVWEVPIKRWRLVFEVNFWGAVYCCRAVLPDMIDRRKGSIINVTSHGATGRSPRNTLYGTTKAALDRLTIGLAEEVREHNIAVNSLGPNLVVTEGAKFSNPGRTEWPGWDPPEIMIEPTVFLALQNADGFTGNVVHAPEYGKDWP